MRIVLLVAVLCLSGCCCSYYGNPNINTYGYQAPPGPSPYARSFMGYDPGYEQSLIDQYVASHRKQVEIFRTQQLGLSPDEQWGE